MNVTNVACVILAAGKSRRFNGNKLSCQLAGRPLIQHIFDCATEVFKDDLFVVIDPENSETISCLPDDARLVENSDSAKGISSSIYQGVKAVENVGDYEFILFLLGDQYAITREDLLNLIKSMRPESLVASTYDGVVGVPAIYSKKYWHELKTLSGDYGASRILKKQPDNLVIVDMPNAKFDIDTTSDLEHAIKKVTSSND